MSALKYYTINLKLEDDQVALLHDIEHDGLEEYAIDEAEVDRLLGEKAFSGGDVDADTIAGLESQLESNRYTLYFHGRNAHARALECVGVLKGEGVIVELIEHDEQDWNEKWRQGYTTVKVSDKLWIVPSWERDQQVVDSGVTALYLYPGQGFGTGRHETTALCLELFELNNYKNKNVLDFGCGSGILGIAANLRHGCDVDYMDIDASALENTKQNLAENKIPIAEEKIILRQNFKAGQKKYDLVFANILLDILIKEKEAIISSLKPGAHLIVSGLLNEHVVAFRSAYSNMKEVSCVSRGDWSALLLEFV